MSADIPYVPKREEPATFRARAATISLTVNDLQKSIAWYRDVAAFLVDEEWKRDGKVVGVSLKAGDVELWLAQDDGAKGWDRQKGEGFSVQFSTVQDVDMLARGIKERGGVLESEPHDLPWGARAFRVKDPDGFKLAFSKDAE